MTNWSYTRLTRKTCHSWRLTWPTGTRSRCVLSSWRVVGSILRTTLHTSVERLSRLRFCHWPNYSKRNIMRIQKEMHWRIEKYFLGGAGVTIGQLQWPKSRPTNRLRWRASLLCWTFHSYAAHFSPTLHISLLRCTFLSYAAHFSPTLHISLLRCTFLSYAAHFSPMLHISLLC